MLNKSYSLLWLGQLVSQVGNRIYLMALAWYFVSVLDSKDGLFLMFIISSLPSLLLGVLVGPLVERWNKKHIIIVCDLISVGLTGLLAWMVYEKMETRALIYAICFLLNTVNLFFSPSVNSILPVIIRGDQLQKGMAYMKMITFLGQIMGAAVGGALVGLVGVYLTILINAVSFLISAFAELFIEYKPEISLKAHHYFREMKEGFLYLKSQAIIRMVLFVSIGCNLFLPVLVVMIPILVDDKMKLDAMHYGFADAMLPLGAILMAVWLANRVKQQTPLKALTIGISIIGLCFLMVSAFNHYGVLLLAVFLYGCFTNYINIQVVTYFLQTVDPAYRGRFFSLLESCSYAIISLAYVWASMVSKLFEVDTALAINGAGLLLFAALAYYWNRKQLAQTKKRIC
ncbi:MAG: MFS transporter [Tannerellaceae bacterium]